MNVVRETRKTCVTITACDQKGLIGRCYDYDANNRHIGFLDSQAPEWFFEGVAHILSDLPEVSLIKTMEIEYPGEGRPFATVLVDRFLDTTVGGVLAATAERIPEQEAIVDKSSGKRVTYHELQSASNHMARVFLDLGTKKGDVIAVLLPNSLEQSICKLGLHKTGAIADNLSPHENCQAIKRFLQQTEATTLILRPGIKDSESINAIYQICPELLESRPGELASAGLPHLKTVIVVRGEKHYPGTLRFEELMASTPRSGEEDLAERLRSVTSRDVATIIHTSGSTSTPKSVLLTHGTIVENALAHVEELGLTASDRILTPVPIFHALGGIGATLSAIIAGATVVAMWKPKPMDAIRAIRDERCSVLITVPSFAISLVETIRQHPDEVNGTLVDLCVMAGAGCSPRTRQEIRQTLGARDVLVMYGMSEAGPGITSTRPSDSPEVKDTTVGRPWPGVEIRLDQPYPDERGNSVGEICIRGYNLMRGYYKNRSETSAVIDAEGWLHTGDLGWLRDDGNLVVCGRRKDVINHHGEMISPKEIEEYLENHPHIDRACVVGAQDYISGEIVCAFLIAKPALRVDDEELLDYCKQGLSPIKIPTHMHFVDDFPRSETGKVLKRELQSMAQKLHDEGAK